MKTGFRLYRIVVAPGFVLMRISLTFRRQTLIEFF